MGKPSKAAEVINAAIIAIEGRKSVEEIAAEIEVESPQMISMLRHGKTALPGSLILPLAKALEIDPSYLLRLFVEERSTKKARQLAQALDDHGVQLVTQNEMELLTHLRAINPGGAPATEEQLAALSAAFETA